MLDEATFLREILVAMCARVGPLFVRIRIIFVGLTLLRETFVEVGF